MNAVIENSSIIDFVGKLIAPFSDKEAARMAGTVDRTIKNIRQGQNAPASATFVNLIANVPGAAEAFMDMVHRQRASIEATQNRIHDIRREAAAVKTDQERLSHAAIDEIQSALIGAFNSLRRPDRH